MQHMRILLQRIESGFYYTESGEWSSAGSEAKDFPDSTAAIDFCLATKLYGIQLVLKFPEEKHEIVIPVLPIQPSGIQGQEAVHRAH
jgi:hypothetical protein